MTEREKGETPASVPYFVYEGQAARHERAIKRLLLALVLAVLLIVVSNLAWLWAWCQYDYESSDTTTTTTEVMQDGRGINVYGDRNEVSRGAEDQNNNDTDTVTAAVP